MLRILTIVVTTVTMLLFGGLTLFEWFFSHLICFDHPCRAPLPSSYSPLWDGMIDNSLLIKGILLLTVLVWGLELITQLRLGHRLWAIALGVSLPGALVVSAAGRLFLFHGTFWPTTQADLVQDPHAILLTGGCVLGWLMVTCCSSLFGHCSRRKPLDLEEHLAMEREKRTF